MPDASLLPFALPAEQLSRAQLFTWASRGPCPAPRHARQPPGAEGLLCTSRNPETTQTFLSTEKLSTESTAGSMGPLCEFQLPLSASQATTWDNCTDRWPLPISQGPMGAFGHHKKLHPPIAPLCQFWVRLAMAVSTLCPSAWGQVHGSSPRNPWGSKGGRLPRASLPSREECPGSQHMQRPWGWR